MPVPLSLAIPAASVGLAYLNAKSSFYYDMNLLVGPITSLTHIFRAQRNGQLNLFYVLEQWANSDSHRLHPFLIFEGRSYSYLQVYDRVLSYGTWMKEKHGVKTGDIVAMDFQNSDTFIFIWFGLWSIGAKPAFINYNLTGNSLSDCIKESTAKLCFIDPAIADNINNDLRAQLPDTSLVVFTPDIETQATSTYPVRSPDKDRYEQDPAQMAAIIFTSGTTGMPKAAIVSWRKCISGSAITKRLLPLNKNEIMYTPMPLYHSTAVIFSFLPILFAGSTQALGRKFSTRNFWQEVRASNATIIQYVGETLRYLLAAPPQIDPVTGKNLDTQHKVRFALGNGLRPDVWDKFKARFGIETICEFYGATEGTFATFNKSSNHLTSGAIGRNGWVYNLVVSPRMAVVEMDWNTDAPHRDPVTGFGRRVNSGDPGELLFKLPAGQIESQFQGYFNNPSATEKKLLRNFFSKGDAWFRTGDAVRWTSDGLLYFHDRLGDTFRWKSENVSTAEVSEVLCNHPSVVEANVYGVELPHHDGRAGCAAVYLSSPPEENTLLSLATHAKAALPRYAVPLFLRVLDGEPGQSVTGTNKLQKNTLRDAGVKPGAADGSLYWLSSEGYVPFGEKQWKELEGGKVKL